VALGCCPKPVPKGLALEDWPWRRGRADERGEQFQTGLWMVLRPPPSLAQAPLL